MTINFGGMGSGQKPMQLDLTKSSGAQGLSLDLTKPNGQALTKVYFGASWDPTVAYPSMDIDTSVFCLHSDGKVHSMDDIVYFKNLDNGYVHHSADARTGEEVDGDGDDEYIEIDLTKVPRDIESIVCVANIFEAMKNNQTFGSVRSEIRVCDGTSNRVLGNIKLSNEYATDTAIVLGQVVRNNGIWEFRLDGSGSMQDLNGILSHYS